MKKDDLLFELIKKEQTHRLEIERQRDRREDVVMLHYREMHRSSQNRVDDLRMMVMDRQRPKELLDAPTKFKLALVSGLTAMYLSSGGDAVKLIEALIK